MRILHGGRRVCCFAVLLLAFAANADWNNPPRGRLAGVEHHTFRSQSMRTEIGYNVCFPPDYAKNPQQRFPVIYYLHGYDGDESSYLKYAEFWRANLARSGPTLLVFVNGGGTSFFSDAPNSSIMGETVVKELVQAIDAKFRTLPNPGARSLHGYSMGGFGALKLAFKYPEQFGSVVAYGPTLATAKEMEKHLGKVYRQMFGSADRFSANDPIHLARTQADKLRGAVKVLTIVGTKDEFLPGARQLQEALKSSNIDHEYIELPGVKHDKDPLYERAAARGFEFSGKAMTAGTKNDRPAKPQ